MSARASHRMLLADDDPRDVELVQLALAQGGLAVRADVVKDGEGVLAYLYRRGPWREREGGEPALLLLDLKMPGMDGIDVIRALRADPTQRSLPVVVFTSSHHEKDILACQEAGANAYVVKPVDFPDFVETVQTLAHFWLTSNRTVSARQPG